MEERYWKEFMTTGSVNDYLSYKGVSICVQVMERYKDTFSETGSSSLKGKGQDSESDNSYRNGVILRSYR